MHGGKNSDRSAAKNDLKVPKKPKKRCTGFPYIGPKLYNMIPKNIKEAQTTNVFKTLLKKWIWKNIHWYKTFDYYYIWQSKYLSIYIFIISYCWMINERFNIKWTYYIRYHCALLNYRIIATRALATFGRLEFLGVIQQDKKTLLQTTVLNSTLLSQSILCSVQSTIMTLFDESWFLWFNPEGMSEAVDTWHFFHTNLAQCLVFLGIL